VDVSEMCGYNIATQVALFHSIKPLFRNRPLLIVLNKSDLRKVADLDPTEKALIEGMKADASETVEFFTTSCTTRDGVDDVRAKACDQLLSMRVDQKVKQGKAEGVRARIHITSTAAPVNRPAFIPASVLKQREGGDAATADGEKQEQLEKDRMIELGGAGVYSVDTWRRAILEDSTWKYDIIPEIMDGHNIVDSWTLTSTGNWRPWRKRKAYCLPTLLSVTMTRCCRNGRVHKTLWTSCTAGCAKGDW